MTVFKPLIHMGGVNDGKYRPAVFQDDGTTLISLAFMDSNWFMTENEAQEISDAMARAYLTGITDLVESEHDNEQGQLPGLPLVSQGDEEAGCGCVQGSQG